MADRYAIFFLPLTLAVSALAWIISGDPVRALAVLVVATPCPLILAVPVAIVSGLSRAARRGIIIKGGGALETLARGKILVLDKTGTITKGEPLLSGVESLGDYDPDELLKLSASLDQVSPHVLARPIVKAAIERGFYLSFPEGAAEEFGSGISGTVNGKRVKLGRMDWVLSGAPPEPRADRLHRRSLLDGSSCIFISVDGVPAGALILDDPVRPDAPLTIRALKRVGFQRIVMLTGDHKDVAVSVGAAIGIDKVLAERSPQEKVDAVLTECSEGITVMVGDGINDAAALASADVGVAMGARGATASSEAADVVLIVDRLDRLIEAVRIARRSRSIAFESIAVGMGLSIVAMLAAAAGFLVPVAGAILQEVIDTIVILNALRALQRREAEGPPGPGSGQDRTPVPGRAREAHARGQAHHDTLRTGSTPCPRRRLSRSSGRYIRFFGGAAPPARESRGRGRIPARGGHHRRRRPDGHDEQGAYRNKPPDKSLRPFLEGMPDGGPGP